MKTTGAPLLLGVDIGTSAVRVGAFNSVGEAVYYARREVPRAFISSGEVDPDRLWKAICFLLKRCVQELRPSYIGGIGVTGQLGLVLLGRDGRILLPASTWMDQRALVEANYIKSTVGDAAVYRIAGRVISPEGAAPKLLWLKRNLPRVLENVEKVISLKDYILYRLTGAIVTDVLHAGYTLLYNIYERKWEKDLCKELGIPVEILGEVRWPHEVAGTIDHGVARMCGLPAGTPVVCGGPDGSMAIVGAGALHPGEAVSVMGTSDVFFALADTPPHTVSGLVINPHASGRLWSVGGPMSTAGGGVRWLMQLFGKSSHSDLEEIEQTAAAISPGADGLLFISAFIGERAPVWDPLTRAVILGLRLSHERPHLLRALYEGTSFAVRLMIDTLHVAGVPVRQVTAVGGGAGSKLWRDIRACILECPVLIPEVTEASLLGAAIAAGIGVGIYKEYASAIDRAIRIRDIATPDSTISAQYRSIYALYNKLLSDLRPYFHGLPPIG